MSREVVCAVSDLDSSDLEELLFLEGHLTGLEWGRSDARAQRPLPRMVDHWTWADRILQSARKPALTQAWALLWPSRLMADIEDGRDIDPRLRHLALEVRRRAHDPVRPGALRERPSRGKLNPLLAALGAVLRARARFDTLVWGSSADSVAIALSEFDRFAFFLEVCDKYVLQPGPPQTIDLPDQTSSKAKVAVRYPDFERVHWHKPRYALERRSGPDWKLRIDWGEPERLYTPVVVL